MANLVVCYQGGDLKLGGYLDADRAGDLDESRSTSCYVLTLGGEPYHSVVRRKIAHHWHI